MKYTFLSFAALLLMLVSCKDDALGPNELGGDTNIPLAEVGNDYGIGISFNGSYVDLRDTLYIIKSENGLVTYKVWADLSEQPLLRAILPADRLDSAGNLNTEIHLRLTSEGIQDFRLANNDFSKPFTIVKYNAAVGDKYEFTDKNGVKVTRTVTEKITDDSFPYGFFLIKATRIEEEPVNDLNGVKKIIYYANHKFGLVQIIVKLDGTSELKLTLYPSKY